MLRRAAALACLLALFAPAGAALGCEDACCGDEAACAGPADAEAHEGGESADASAPCEDEERGCPSGCPDCACCARRPATPAESASVVPVLQLLALPMLEPSRRHADADPREILHVPLA